MPRVLEGAWPSSDPSSGRALAGLAELLLEPGWRGALQQHMSGPSFARLEAFWVQAQRGAGRGGPPVYPPAGSTFAAFHATPLDRVRVVILGQDPYHGPGQATGLSFSVPRGCPPPPSLRNMFKELASDVPGFRAPGAGFRGEELLASWAAQGVLMLNSCLSVRKAQAASHAGQGWEDFTDAALRELSTATSRVRRAGREQELASEALVPGDIVLLEAGDVVPADLRLVEVEELQADESTLTGESLPVDKAARPEKVTIEGTEVYGQSAGHEDNGKCLSFARSFVEDPTEKNLRPGGFECD